MMIINRTDFRASTPSDWHKVRAVHDRAFGSEVESRLALTLLEDNQTASLDLLAELDGMVIGHVILSAAEEGPDRALVLGPLAVDPEWRDFQIGTELVRRVLADARLAGWKSVFALGEPDYYGRFGFKRSFTEHVTCAYNAGPSFQGLELETGALAGFSGKLVYPAAFQDTD
ncbi:MAG: N-acetyltransferase [Pseudomonadota bacterium]